MHSIRDDFSASQKSNLDQLLRLCARADWFDRLSGLVFLPVAYLVVWPAGFALVVLKHIGAKGFSDQVQARATFLTDPIRRAPFLVGYVVILILIWIGLRLGSRFHQKCLQVQVEMRSVVQPVEATAIFCFEAADELRRYIRAKMPSDFGLGGDLDYFERRELWCHNVRRPDSCRFCIAVEIDSGFDPLADICSCHLGCYTAGHLTVLMATIQERTLRQYQAPLGQTLHPPS